MSEEKGGDRILSPVARRLGTSYGRMTRAARVLGFSPDEFVMLVAIVEVRAPWSAKALSEYTGIPKTTVLRKLRRGLDRGYLSQSGGGWSFHADWLFVAISFIEETVLISQGDQSGYSDSVIDAFIENQRIRDIAAALSYSPIRV